MDNALWFPRLFAVDLTLLLGTYQCWQSELSSFFAKDHRLLYKKFNRLFGWTEFHIPCFAFETAGSPLFWASDSDASCLSSLVQRTAKLLDSEIASSN